MDQALVVDFGEAARLFDSIRTPDVSSSSGRLWRLVDAGAWYWLACHVTPLASSFGTGLVALLGV
ncbi:hypothetical protein [Streptomyces sp. WAC 01325]|uniref:hypothetical protein n=1 Tax=Streptomyces sp. WAC 01325 TaxID=2203202 RepID=UPI000F877D88|nr:hypothetical protein [Streptomyces sp. WAC 01325]